MDYSLFMVSRFREELRERLGKVEEALRRTMQTAGRTVFFSGLTVIVSLLSLFVFPLNFLQSMGVGGAAAVVVAMVGALTVLQSSGYPDVYHWQVCEMGFEFLGEGGAVVAPPVASSSYFTKSPRPRMTISSAVSPKFTRNERSTGPRLALIAGLTVTLFNPCLRNRPACLFRLR